MGNLFQKQIFDGQCWQLLATDRPKESELPKKSQSGPHLHHTRTQDAWSNIHNPARHAFPVLAKSPGKPAFLEGTLVFATGRPWFKSDGSHLSCAWMCASKNSALHGSFWVRQPPNGFEPPIQPVSRPTPHSCLRHNTHAPYFSQHVDHWGMLQCLP